MKNTNLWLLAPAIALAACRTQTTTPAKQGKSLGGLTVSVPHDKPTPPAAAPDAGLDVAYVFGPTAPQTTVASAADVDSSTGSTEGQRLVARLPKITEKLRTALRGQRKLLQQQDRNKTYSYGGEKLTTQDFIDVIDGILEEGVGGYAPTAVSVAKRNQVEFTAYYSPDITASRVKTATHRYPVLRLPDSEVARSASRAELDGGGVVDLASHALAWVAHPLDVYMLQLQGSGYVSFPDGERVYLAYARSNGRAFKSIKTAIETVEPQVARRGVKGIRKWMSEDLANRGKLLELCDNYIFFGARSTAPTGSAGVPLTPMVSVAADPQHYPPGAVLLAEVPVAGNPRIKEARILLVQDTGAAIKGAKRLDLYTGVGAEALDIARLSSHVGEVYVLAPSQGG